MGKAATLHVVAYFLAAQTYLTWCVKIQYLI